MAVAMHQRPDDDEDLKCSHCLSKSLFLDWSAGDRVCTNCGVVNEQHVRDESAEWREFSEDADKGLPSIARCGLIPNDESKWVGGLPPTSLTSQPFGGHDPRIGHGKSGGGAAHRVALVRTHRKIEKMLEKQHAAKVKEAELARKVMLRRMSRNRGKSGSGGGGGVASVGNDDSGDEQDARGEEYLATKQALNAEKWSLERALSYHGTADDREAVGLAFDPTTTPIKGLDPAHKKASSEIYQAYQAITKAGTELSLPHPVLRECYRLVCHYATTKNGIFIRGISKKTDPPIPSTDHTTTTTINPHKTKMIHALSAALIYIMTKKHGSTARTLSDVCRRFPGIKPKTCSNAISELKSTIPQLFTGRDPATDAVPFVDQSSKVLELPPSARGCSRALALRLGREQLDKGWGSGVSAGVIGAASVYFVSLAGATMQRLATQALRKFNCDSLEGGMGFEETRRRRGGDKVVGSKRKRTDDDDGSSDDNPHIQSKKPCVTLSSSSSIPTPCRSIDQPEFDALSSEPLYDHKKEKELETIQGWFSWSNQQRWHRDLNAIHNSCPGTSRAHILDFYKTYLHPRRRELLEVVQEYLTTCDDGDVCYLVSITSAAPLMIMGQQ